MGISRSAPWNTSISPWNNIAKTVMDENSLNMSQKCRIFLFNEKSLYWEQAHCSIPSMKHWQRHIYYKEESYLEAGCLVLCAKVHVAEANSINSVGLGTQGHNNIVFNSSKWTGLIWLFMHSGICQRVLRVTMKAPCHSLTCVDLQESDLCSEMSSLKQWFLCLVSVKLWAGRQAHIYAWNWLKQRFTAVTRQSNQYDLHEDCD